MFVPLTRFALKKFSRSIQNCITWDYATALPLQSIQPIRSYTKIHFS